MTQCEFCGRVHQGMGIWTRPAGEPVTFVGFCPPCGLLEKLRVEREERRAIRRKLRERASRKPDPSTVKWDELTRGK